MTFRPGDKVTFEIENYEPRGNWFTFKGSRTIHYILPEAVVYHEPASRPLEVGDSVRAKGMPHGPVGTIQAIVGNKFWIVFATGADGLRNLNAYERAINEA